MGDHSGDREFDWEIGSSIGRRFSGIATCWDIAWETDLEDCDCYGIGLGGLDFGVRLEGLSSNQQETESE